VGLRRVRDKFYNEKRRPYWKRTGKRDRFDCSNGKSNLSPSSAFRRVDPT